MFNRFKSALYSAVGVEENNSNLVNDNSNDDLKLLLSESFTGASLQADKRLSYGRPAFLQLNSLDEVSVTADHTLRPIICPRSFLPWHSGYAETVNAGKSKHNEDQASVHVACLTHSMSGAMNNGAVDKELQSSNTSTIVNNLNFNKETANGTVAMTEEFSGIVEDCAKISAIPSTNMLSILPVLSMESRPSLTSVAIDNSFSIDLSADPTTDATVIRTPLIVSPTADIATSYIQESDVPTDKSVQHCSLSVASESPSNVSDPIANEEKENVLQKLPEMDKFSTAGGKMYVTENCVNSNVDVEADCDNVCVDKVTKCIESEGLSKMLDNVDIKSINESPVHDSSSFFESNMFLNEGHGKVSVSLPYYYFAVFDGHAGWGAAHYASQNLHHILQASLNKVKQLILQEPQYEDLPAWQQQSLLDEGSIVVGALEQAFHLMDRKIEQDRQRLGISGGCTACVALFLKGKLYVANAGDSRATLCLHESPYSMSYDFTPETENYRIRKLGAQQPELLAGEYNPVEFLRRPLNREVGTLALCRHPYMPKGWVYKKITEEDLKYPLVCGTGKRSRVMATIGVTRGFGDHDLKAQCTNVHIKPFLSSEPEVRVLDLSGETLTDTDVLILATDGLWDIMTNEKAVSTLLLSMGRSLQLLPGSIPHRHRYRYTSAAQDLVMGARGKLTQRTWRNNDNKHATIDDVSVFVVPLKPYQEEYIRWNSMYKRIIEQKHDGAVSQNSDAISNGNKSTVSKNNVDPSINCR